tara:strand:+ start:67 stop:387 length:321 start_codon:yes stop_codon:yes gene_type:complete
MSHQDWKIVTFDVKTKPDNKKQISSQLPSKKEYTFVNKELPLALQQARNSRNLTQKILSNKLNLVVTDLNAWERGLKIPSNDIIARLSKELGVKLPRNTKLLKEPE